MANIYDFFDASRAAAAFDPLSDMRTRLQDTMADATAELRHGGATVEMMGASVARHGERMIANHGARTSQLAEAMQNLSDGTVAPGGGTARLAAWSDYMRDAGERMVLTLDILRRRGDIFLEHEAAGCPPVLAYDYEVVVSGRDLPRPSNYALLRILPPEGTDVDEAKRPFIIIDPRAGHGPGIGGFKTDSQVGVGLKAGHPVYFVSFGRMPEPGQYLSDVTRAEAEFVREVTRRHPDAPKPIVTGNCQGGWATLLLAATNPDITGPIVVNGAPVAPWSGKIGENPMRYNGGVFGGAWVPMFLSDLGGGLFDGAHLVQNFELLNPARTMYRKYVDLYRDVDRGAERFLEFETWWGGFFLLNEAEIRWIVEQLFVGNRLVKNEARLEPGRPVDLKAIRSPIIVFASHGDNITPPQQALNWITETYADVSEIRIRGQRIVYMVHEQVGHLGIFVSGSIAKREHSEVNSTLATIEALAPGLYEMVIEDVHGEGQDRRFTVSFAERGFDDIRKLDDTLEDERPFAAVARTSEIQAQVYETLVRPAVRSVVTPSLAEASRALHPQRTSRAVFASKSPAMSGVAALAQKVRDNRHAAPASNPFLKAEAVWIDAMTQAIDLWRDQRDMMVELAFLSMWSTPWARAFGRRHELRRTLKDEAELRALPQVQAALAALETGGFADAVIRMLVLLAENRKGVRRDRLERSNRVLTEDEPFASIGPEGRSAMISQQTLIATYEPERAIETLPQLLKTPDERDLAIRVAYYVPGDVDEMAQGTLAVLHRFCDVLGVPRRNETVSENPLAAARARANGTAALENGATLPAGATASGARAAAPKTAASTGETTE